MGLKKTTLCNSWVMEQLSSNLNLQAFHFESSLNQMSSDDGLHFTYITHNITPHYITLKCTIGCLNRPSLNTQTQSWSQNFRNFWELKLCPKIVLGRKHYQLIVNYTRSEDKIQPSQKLNSQYARNYKFWIYQQKSINKIIFILYSRSQTFQKSRFPLYSNFIW